MGQELSHQFESESAEATYQRYRKLAGDEAKLRNDCFSQSQSAFTSRQGLKAKELSQKGKEHGKKMEQYNSKAAEVIFNENNKNRPPNELDLHGLYVKEALLKTELKIQYCKAKNIDNLTIIVGRGKHSSNGVAKLKPAIAELMEKYQFHCILDKPTVGCLYVEFGHKPTKEYLSSFLETLFGERCVIC
ncbi:8004_t:CDS:2 [Funneliformis geosporum]|uniref:10628_t:CDS:1 n=1 Tax=Funneliformis geosporum TaxID=1117311 RepID=A0A9W4WX88_9GLOM|nr:10628_t:CDS:2 [Funneliformis geosporum]CAI2193012.1 8004_t:CDS:2 [Funneliformis geosporum]